MVEHKQAVVRSVREKKRSVHPSATYQRQTARMHALVQINTARRAPRFQRRKRGRMQRGGKHSHGPAVLVVLDAILVAGEYSLHVILRCVHRVSPRNLQRRAFAGESMREIRGGAAMRGKRAGAPRRGRMLTGTRAGRAEGARRSRDRGGRTECWQGAAREFKLQPKWLLLLKPATRKPVDPGAHYLPLGPAPLPATPEGGPGQ
jgi:hypothetical protein